MQIHEFINYFEPIVVLTSKGSSAGTSTMTSRQNLTGLRLPAAAGSLKTRPHDSFRFKYAENTSSFNQAWIAQLVEHAGLVQRTGVRFPSKELFFN